MDANDVSEALLQFFRSCPPELMASYGRKYVDETRSADRIVRALATRFSDRKQVRAGLKELDNSHHLALIAIIQAGGIAGGTWLLQEMTASHGKREDFWADVLHGLGRHLLVFGNSHQAPPLFYVLPLPLLEVLASHFTRRLALPRDLGGDVRLSKDTNFNFPVGYSITSVLTYLQQNRLRVTQKGEIFKKNQQEFVGFFANLWGINDAGKVLAWHLELMRQLGLLRISDGFLEPHEEWVSEWLDFEPQQRRDLFLSCFESQEPLMPWLLILLADVPEGEWVPIEPLNVMYRRRYMGTVFQKRFLLKSYYLPPSGFYNPMPPLESMAISGLLERGLGPDGSLVRISASGREFMAGKPLGEAVSDVPVQFLLQPNFEILAPAGLPLDQLYRLGEMCEFVSCDRMNRYLLTGDTVRAAVDRGWRRSELLRFLREGAAHGVPQNVDSTVDEWIGDRGEVEFHDALVATIHPAREAVLIDALEELAPGYRRMAPGVFAMARSARKAVAERLGEAGLNPTPWVRAYNPPVMNTDAFAGAVDRVTGGEDVGLAEVLADPAEFPTRQLVVLQPPDARAQSPDDSMEMFTALNGDGRPIASLGHDLGRKPGAAGSGDLLKLSPAKTMDLVRAAVNRNHDIEILYRRSGGGAQVVLTRVTPRKIRGNGGMSSFEGLEHGPGEERSFVVKRIQGIRLVR